MRGIVGYQSIAGYRSVVDQHGIVDHQSIVGHQSHRQRSGVLRAAPQLGSDA